MAEIEGWIPLTGLGKMVATGEITSIDQVLESGKPIKESEIVDAFLPDLVDEVLDITMVQRMTDSGRRVKFRTVVVVGNKNGYIGFGQGKAKFAVGCAGDGVTVMGFNRHVGGNAQPDVDDLLPLSSHLGQQFKFAGVINHNPSQPDPQGLAQIEPAFVVTVELHPGRVGSAPLSEGELMRKYGYEGFPVVDNDKVVGLLTRRSVDRPLAHKLNLSAASLMDAGNVTISPGDSLQHLQAVMTDTGWGQIPVVDEKGFVVGIVTRTDLLKTLAPRAAPGSRPQNLAKKLEHALPAEHLALLKGVIKVAANGATALFIVGGFVRDLLLDRPSLDFDLVVEGDAISLAESALADIRRALDTAPTTTPGGEHGDALEGAAVRLEAGHPGLAGAIRSVIDALAKAGI